MTSILSLSYHLIINGNVGERINYYKNSNIDGFRINISKCPVWEYDLLFKNLFDLIHKHQLQGYEFIFDLPYPFKKTRIIKMLDGYWEVAPNQKLYLREWKNQNQLKRNYVYLDKLNLNIMVGDEIYFADGYGPLVCEGMSPDEIVLCAQNSFKIFEGKSFSGGKVRNCDALDLFHLCKDLSSLVDHFYFALSFVEEENDILSFCTEVGCSPNNILSKIETQKGVDNLTPILLNSTGILLGRGDLFYYSKPRFFFRNCTDTIKKTLLYDKKFYLCTDVLISLIERNVPTRAELMDVLYYKSIGCENFILPAGLSNKGNLKKAVEIINY